MIPNAESLREWINQKISEAQKKAWDANIDDPVVCHFYMGINAWDMMRSDPELTRSLKYSSFHNEYQHVIKYREAMIHFISAAEDTATVRRRGEPDDVVRVKGVG